MVGRAYAHTMLAAMRQETIVLFNHVSQQSALADVDNDKSLNDIAQMIDEQRYATARVYLETLLERLPISE